MQKEYKTSYGDDGSHTEAARRGGWSRKDDPVMLLYPPHQPQGVLFYCLFSDFMAVSVGRDDLVPATMFFPPRRGPDTTPSPAASSFFHVLIRNAPHIYTRAGFVVAALINSEPSMNLIKHIKHGRQTFFKVDASFPAGSFNHFLN